MKRFRYLSVCSGIEAATVAWHPLGWQAEAFSEIEKFPCALLAHYYPDVPNWGDMTRFQEWPDATVDVLVGGTPCQAFSVAGLRAGLADPRGNLTLTYLAIAARYRPRWLVWENVPGVLSDRTGAFGSLLGGLAKLGYGWAYRVLDAQYFRVAQQRRRVFVVGSLGGWRRAGAILFERESLSGNPPPRREARKDVAPTLAARTRGGGGLGTDAELDGALIAQLPPVSMCLNAGAMGRVDAETETMIPIAIQSVQAVREKKQNGIGIKEPGEPGMKQQTYLAQHLRVRRLTPRECERLQGFPDDFTLIPYRGKPAKDGPRYKAIGNSMAVPVMRWIGERIALVDALAPYELEAA